MKSKIFLLLTIFLLSGCSSNNKDSATNSIPTPSSEVSQSVQDAYDLLVNTETFASAAVGFAGSVSEQVKAFRAILDSDNSEQLFTNLQTEAKLAGQLYGVCGLYLTNKEKFNEVIPAYQNNRNKVTTFFGCIMDETEVALLVTSFEDGSLPLSFQNCVIE